MKYFLKLLFILLFIEITIGFLSLIDDNFPEIIKDFIHIIIYLISLPLSLIDRTYPFYAEGSLFFQFFLFTLNLIIQTAIAYFILRRTKFKKSIKQ